MMDLVETCRRVEAEAHPHVKYDRLNGASGDLTEEVFLNDLVDAGAYVPEPLKRAFLMIWADEPVFFNATPGVDEEGITHSLVVEFAAIEPVIDLGPNWA